MIDDRFKLALGSAIRTIRQAKRLTQEDVAHECQSQPHYISMIEGGKRMPSIAKVFQIAAALELKPSELVQHIEDVMDGKPITVDVISPITSKPRLKADNGDRITKVAPITPK